MALMTKLAESYTEMMAQAQQTGRRARRKRFHNVIMLGLSGAGIAAALAGLPLSVSLAFIALGIASGYILRKFA
jgi:hypothetical protein